MSLDPSKSRGALMSELIALAEQNGQTLSVSRAGRLAERIQRGDYVADELHYLRLTYADPTGNEAAWNIDNPAAA